MPQNRLRPYAWEISARLADDRFFQARRAGTTVQLPSLQGLCITLKDGHSTSFSPITAGHPQLKNYLVPQDSTVVQRLQTAGAIVLGKTNVPEKPQAVRTIRIMSSIAPMARIAKFLLCPGQRKNTEIERTQISMGKLFSGP